jgi:hypothetical protein
MPVSGSSIARYLVPGESIVREVHHHFVLLLRPFLAAVGGIVAASVLGALTTPDDGAHPIDTVLGLAAIFFALRFFWKGIQWWADRIVITNQRIFQVAGVFTRNIASMPMAKMTDLTYRRSLGGRIFGFGEIIVETAGQHQGLGHLNYLPRPDDFYRTVVSLVTARDPLADPFLEPAPLHLEEPASVGPDEAEPPGPDEAGPPYRPDEAGPPYRPDEEDTGPLPRVVL